MQPTNVDILIIGAGVSGIGVACRIKQQFPDRRVLILERRTAIGGTWDLFRYPGIRSDSDMFTYSYEFKPWDRADIFAGGETIKDYIAGAADEFGVREHIRFRRRVLSADWQSQDRRWRIEARNEENGEQEEYGCRFLVACTGYYSYDRGYVPDYPGKDAYRGQLIHPQHWPEDLDYAGKTVLVIGSGATTATLVPAIAGTARHVTVVQRSPSYFYSVPRREVLFGFLDAFLPGATVSRLLRKQNLAIQYVLYKACRRWPGLMRRFLLRHVRNAIGPDIEMRHFTPSYGPWDERLCVLPEDDLFESLRVGDASLHTGEIETFTETGLRLTSGETFDADIIVSATGFDLRAFGGIEVAVDGQAVRPNDRMIYKGALVEGVPNLATVFGYVNFTWTAKVELAGKYLCRLLGHMEATGAQVAIARDDGGHALDASIISKLNSGYVRRGADNLPRQGRDAPWAVSHDYRIDRRMMLREPVDDGVLTFQ